MWRQISIAVGLLWIVGAAAPLPVQSQAPRPVDAAARSQRVVEQYCVSCHNDRTRTAGLSLQAIDFNAPAAHADTLEKVIRKIEAGMMPPVGMPRPDAATLVAVVDWAKSALDRAAAEAPNPGRAILRRLNRVEYGNAIRDLLDLDIDAASLLPPDDSSYGFDNIADVLNSSPALLDRYLAAADEISTLALGSIDDSTPGSKTFVAPSDTTQNEHVEGLPLGTRGGLAVRHVFPLTGEYVFRIRLWRNNSSSIRGLSQPHDVELTLDGQRVFLETVGTPEDYKALLTNPPDAEALVDPRLQVRVPVTAGPHTVGVSFIYKTGAPNVTLLRPLLASHDPISVDGFPRIDWLLIGGPFNPQGPGDTPSRRRILTCTPASSAAEEPCARRILAVLARRAYRRDVTDADVAPLLEFYRRGRARGSFDAGLTLALRRLLVDPAFLFRAEAVPAGAAPGRVLRVSDVDLASRLSFFLWSSIPDDELLDAAHRGRLSEPAVLREQVRRMLASPKASAMVENFAGQWLFLRNLQRAHPDTQEFPDFDDSLRQAFRRETELLFDSIMREDRSVLELLAANYTFVNERLARHYGIKGVFGSRFRRVPITDPARFGLLGQGSVLTVTSYPNRTSPVLRGKWILEQLMGTPPPPPPPNVPALMPAAGNRPRTMKEQMEVHRANPACANCHKLMDPLGFALENFDGVGAWRLADHGTPIDAGSVLADGTPVDGVVALRQALLRRPGMFVGTMTEKLLTYALGRGLTASDMPAVRGVVAGAAPQQYRFSDIVMGIVTSVPFRMRMVPQPDPGTTATQ